MITMMVILAALVVFGALAIRFGADSRDLDIENLKPAEMHAQI